MASRDVVGKAVYSTEVDQTGLVKGAKDAEATLKKTGATVEQEFERSSSRSMEKLSTLGRKSVSVLSGAAAGIFAVAARGALQAESATAAYRAETGATEEQAKKATETMLRLNRSNTDSIEEIGAAQAALRSNMGLTEDQIDTMAQSFLDFGKVTGQDNVKAIGALDDILDSWNLTAEDAQGLMDQLVRSHQLYGGSVEENQKALTDLAPALQAANLSLDDGIGLLNLFAESGLDAAAAPTALQKALTKVKSPAELQALIEDIRTTDNDFTRAQKAADLFGSRAGAKLANALRPGKASMDDLIVTAEEAAGTVKTASDAIDSSFGMKVQLAIKNATGALAELGNEFGPAGSLFMAISSAAPLLSGPLKKLGKGMGADVGLSMVAEIGKRLLAAVGVGGALSAGALASAGIVVAVPVALILGKDDLTRFLEEQADNLSELLGGSGNVNISDLPKNDGIVNPMAGGKTGANGSLTTAELRALGLRRQALERWATDDAGAMHAAYIAAWDSAWRSRPIDWSLVRQTGDDMVAAFGDTGRKAGVTFTDEWGKSAGQGEGPTAALRSAGWEKNLISGMQDSMIAAGVASRAALASILPGAFAVMPPIAAKAGEETGDNLWQEMVRGLARGETPVRDAMEGLRWALEHPMAAARLKAIIEGALTSEELAKGLRSRRPWIRAEAEATKANLIAQWEQATGLSWDKGLSIQENLARGMKRNRHKPRTEAKETKGAVDEELSKAPEAAYKDGERVASQFAAGIKARTDVVSGAGQGLGKALHNSIHQSSPAKVGPLSEDGGTYGWGLKAGDLYASGLLASVGRVRGAVSSLVSPLASLTGGATGLAAANPTINVGGRVEVVLSGETMATARSMGASWDDIGRMAAALANPLADASRMSGLRFTSPRRV